MRKLIILVCLIALSGCSDISEELELIKNENIQLEVEKTELEDVIVSLENDLNELNGQISILNSDRNELLDQIDQLEDNNRLILEFSNTPMFKIKLAQQFGMDIDYLVESIEESSIYYHRFDYQHNNDPDGEMLEMSIESIFETVEIGGKTIERYKLIPYIDFGTYQVDISPNSSFSDEFESKEEFRSHIALLINKPFSKGVSMAVNYLIVE